MSEKNKSEYEEAFEQDRKRKITKRPGRHAGQSRKLMSGGLPKLESEVYVPVAGLQEFFVDSKIKKKIAAGPVKITVELGKNPYKLDQVVLLNAGREKFKARILNVQPARQQFILTLERINEKAPAQ